MRLLLRILTRKSIIGFGNFKNTTVDDLLSIRDYESLISMYYNLELISFDEDVLNELSIEGNLVIEKPGKDKEKYSKIHKELATQLREIKGLVEHEEHSHNPMDNYSKRALHIRQVKETSKMLNRNRIQRIK